MRLDKNITRRDFIRIVGAATTTTLLRDTNLSAAPAGKKKLWKGFNLLNKSNPNDMSKEPILTEVYRFF